MQMKRLGPGCWPPRIVMPTSEIAPFMAAAQRLASRIGKELGSRDLLLSPTPRRMVDRGYLVDHRNGAFAVDLMIAPALTDLAMKRHRGRPYVLGRWQSAWFARRH
jgi:hypothetical protein